MYVGHGTSLIFKNTDIYMKSKINLSRYRHAGAKGEGV
jgi:hypothetical protein